jgi:hypothetical protein
MNGSDFIYCGLILHSADLTVNHYAILNGFSGFPRMPALSADFGCWIGCSFYGADASTSPKALPSFAKLT